MTDSYQTAAVIVAGGSGERFGRTGGKQLAPVRGLPVLAWSIRALAAAPEIDVIVVVAPHELAEKYRREAIEPAGVTKPVLLADSGETRQRSVQAGLERLPHDAGVVVVHDGARPLIESSTVSAALRALADSGADGVVVAHPSVDTLKVVEDGLVVETPPRSRFWQVQTPQVFLREALLRAHDAAEKDGFTGTDDASLVERAGGEVRVFEGPRDNIKVTLPEDLAFVDAVLGQREGEVGQ